MKKDSRGKWFYRPDKQLEEELTRMRRVDAKGAPGGSIPGLGVLKLVRQPEAFDPAKRPNSFGHLPPARLSRRAAHGYIHTDVSWCASARTTRSTGTRRMTCSLRWFARDGSAREGSRRRRWVALSTRRLTAAGPSSPPKSGANKATPPDDDVRRRTSSCDPNPHSPAHRSAS